MAEPNLVNVTSIYGKTVGAALGTSANTSILTAASNKLIKINSVIVANIDGSNSADVTVQHNDGSNNRYKIANTINVPADTTLVVVGKDSPIYLQETQILEAWASATSDLHILVSYELMDDA